MCSSSRIDICVIGDTHGHLQLALAMAAAWQEELGIEFEAVFLCGDVGTFRHESQLDNATRSHAKRNPCELEFLTQWSINPQPSHIQRIFSGKDVGGFGILAPVVFVHGNHEGHEHLETLVRHPAPEAPVSLVDLPFVDSGNRLRYLQSGCRVALPGGLIVAGIGGIEQGRRGARYHPLAYISEQSVLQLAEEPIDLLVTHQGPSQTQGDGGSDSLDLMVRNKSIKLWAHGHSILNPDVSTPNGTDGVKIVPLGDIAFPMKGEKAHDPGEDSMLWIRFGDEVTIKRGRPDCWRRFSFYKWMKTKEGLLMCPKIY